MADSLTFDDIDALLSYDASTGVLTWKVSRGMRVRAGDVAGCINGCGYVVLKVKQRMLQAHRIAWLLSTGSWPKADIDHINGKRADNRLNNLRDVPRQVNAMNRKSPRCSAGVIGVGRTSSGKWQSRLAGRYLGVHETAQAAGNARLEALKEVERKAGL